ncbi:MAG: hypothetical protein ACRDAX_03800 [Propionibacteriaceae bacterium]
MSKQYHACRAWSLSLLVLMVVLVSACSQTLSKQQISATSAWIQRYQITDSNNCRELVASYLGLCSNRESSGIVANEVGDDIEFVSSSYGTLKCRKPNQFGQLDSCALPLPLWAVEPTKTSVVAQLKVLVGNPDIASLPTDAVATAAVRVKQLGWVSDRDDIVIAFPAGVETLNNMTQGEADQRTGAVTIISDSQTYIVVNPVVRAASKDVAAALLAHELIHAYAETAAWDMKWLSEGWAEYAATSLSSQLLTQSQQALQERLQSSKPQDFPSNEAFAISQGSEADYALARVAIEVLVAHLGEEEARILTQQWMSGKKTEVTIDQLRLWWRERLENMR